MSALHLPPTEPPPLTDHMRIHLVSGLRAMLHTDQARMRHLRRRATPVPAHITARVAALRADLADLAELGARP